MSRSAVEHEPFYLFIYFLNTRLTMHIKPRSINKKEGGGGIFMHIYATQHIHLIVPYIHTSQCIE